MDKRSTDSIDHLDTVEACQSHIRDLQQRLERLQLAAELNPIRGDRPYKVLGYLAARMFSRDDRFGVYAEYKTLAEAVVYCRQQIDGQIAHLIAEAESGLLTTARDIDDAIAELALTGWCFWVSNVADPSAGDAFDFRAYARDRLTAAVKRMQTTTSLQTCQAANVKSYIRNRSDLREGGPNNTAGQQHS